jgi:hypothetical protein
MHPPILYGSTEFTFTHTMHDKMDHVGEKSWGNTCSSLHKMTQMSPSSRSISSSVKLVEHMPLKNVDISTSGLTTLSGSDPRNAIGRSYCISTSLSWLFNPDIVCSFSRTQRETFEAYSSGTLTFRRILKKCVLSSLEIVWQAASIYVLPSTTVNGCSFGLKPIFFKSCRAAKLSFVFPLISKIVPSMLSMTFFFLYA